MRELRHLVDSKTLNGSAIHIYRNFFIYDKPRDYFKNTHKEFSYNEKKLAKLQHKTK